MPRPVHFELEAEDPERAVRFYTDVFGWKFDKWEQEGFPYWLITTGGPEEPGIDGGLGPRQPGHTPGTVNTIGVEDLDAALAAVQGAGGKVVRPKEPIPGIGWLAYCEDTEGNPFGMMQGDPSAA
jgi:predicted enzyme related to lactoylglutathione lyase